MQAISEGEGVTQEPEVNGIVLKHRDQDFLGKEHSQSRERHRRVDPLPVEARKKEVERLQGIIQNLRREAVTTKNKAEQEIKQRDAEIEALRRSCQLQREHIEKQKKEILALEFTLRDYRITDMDQQRALFKCNTNAEAQLHRLRLQLASMQQAHEQAQERAQQHLAASRKEKAALCMGLAAIAQQSIGGPDASAEDLAADVESAVAENSEPIPRNASAWSQLKFHLDDMGNLAIVNRGPSSHLRPFDRDGARAVAALCAQVARLFSQRGALRSRLRVLEEQNKKGVHADSSVLQDLVAALQSEVHRLSKICQDLTVRPQGSSPREETIARQDANGDDGAATTTATSAPPEQGMAAVQQVVSHMLMLLSAAHKEELAYRSGCSSPASKQSRSTPMASRGRAKGSPKRPRPTPAMTMYKEATDYCAAILQKEVAAHNAARASASPPRTTHEQPSSYAVPLKLATKSGMAATGPAATRKGVVLHGQHQPQQQGQRLQQKQQQREQQPQQQREQQQQQQQQQQQREQQQQQQQQQQLQKEQWHQPQQQREQQHQPQQEQPQQEQQQQQQQQEQQQQQQQQQQREQQQQQQQQEQEQEHQLQQEQQQEQQREQQQQQQYQQQQHQQNPPEVQEQQQHQQLLQQEQHHPQPSNDMDGQEVPPPQQAPSSLSSASSSSLSSSSSSSSSSTSSKGQQEDDDENYSSSGSSMQAGDDEFEEVEGED